MEGFLEWRAFFSCLFMLDNTTMDMDMDMGMARARTLTVTLTRTRTQIWTLPLVMADEVTLLVNFQDIKLMNQLFASKIVYLSNVRTFLLLNVNFKKII
jgi:hypothetical protein